MQNFAQTQLKPGDTLPYFSSQTILNQPFNLDTTLSTPTLLFFWASWNTNSLQLLQELKQNYLSVNPIKRGKQQLNIQFIDVSLDQDSEMLHAALKRENLPWPTHLVENKGWESDLIHQLNLNKIPTLVVIDSSRKIILCDPDPKLIKNYLSNIVVNQGLSN